MHLHLIPNQECKVVDVATGEENTEVGPDGISAAGETLDADGFLHTGDVAVYHDGGYFSTVERVKAPIKYKGYQIAPAELEAVLLTHNEVMGYVAGRVGHHKKVRRVEFIDAVPKSNSGKIMRPDLRARQGSIFEG